MSKQTLKFNDTEVSKKDFDASKQSNSFEFSKYKDIVVSYKVKHIDDSYKYFIGYSHNDVIRLLYVILPQVSGYIKYFENGGKNFSFKIEEESVYLKYSEIWNKIKSISNVKLHSQPNYDKKYIKIKVKTFNSMVNTLFSENEVPEERIHYVYICIDSVLRVEEKIILRFI